LTNSEFKQTEIGLIPEDWEIDCIDNHFNIKQGKQLSQKTREGKNQKKFLRTSNVLWCRLDLDDLDEMHFTGEEQEKLKLNYGDVLVCEGGDIGRTAIWKNNIDDCLYQNHIHRLRKKKGTIDVFYFMYWMYYAIAIENKYLSFGNRTTIPNLSASRLKAFLFPLPILQEQNKIAYILSKIQQAIEKQEQIIKTTQELKKALMQKLFTEGLNGEEQKETEIGLIPKSWEVCSIGSVFKFSSGKSRPKDISKTRDIEYKYPVYGGNGIMGFSKEYLFNAILLIIGRVGEYCGCAHLTEGKSWVSDNALYSKVVLKEISSEFIADYLNYLNLNKYSNKMGQPLITQGIIEKVMIALPPLKEQSEIAAILLAVDSKFDSQKGRFHYLHELFKTMLNELMTGQLRAKDIDFEDE